MTVLFDPLMPPPFIPLIQEAWEKVKPLVPPYIDRVSFCWRPESESAMNCNHDQAYRMLSVGITPGSFDGWSQPEDYLRHEIAHWFNAPLEDAALKVIKAILGDDYPTPGSRVAEDYLRHVCESVNVDLEQTFKRLMCS